MKVQNKNNMKNEVMEKGRKSTEKVFTTLLVDGRLLESEPSSQVSLSPLLLPTATTMGQFFWSNQQQTHSHLIFSEGITNMDCYYYYYNCSSYIRKENNFPCRIIIFKFFFRLKIKNWIGHRTEVIRKKNGPDKNVGLSRELQNKVLF